MNNSHKNLQFFDYDLNDDIFCFTTRDYRVDYYQLTFDNILDYVLIMRLSKILLYIFTILCQ